MNGKNEKEDKLYEAITGLLVRVSALEKILIEKKIVESKEEYHKYLSGSVKEYQDILKKLLEVSRTKDKILS